MLRKGEYKLPVQRPSELGNGEKGR
jgi:hypothetical protein